VPDAPGESDHWIFRFSEPHFPHKIKPPPAYTPPPKSVGVKNPPYAAIATLATLLPNADILTYMRM